MFACDGFVSGCRELLSERGTPSNFVLGGRLQDFGPKTGRLVPRSSETDFSAIFEMAQDSGDSTIFSDCY